MWDLEIYSKYWLSDRSISEPEAVQVAGNHLERREPFTFILTCSRKHLLSSHLDFLAPLPPTHPPPSVPGHLVWGSLLCGTAADYVIISGPFWSLAVCVCETNEAFQRDACQNDHNLHQSCRCVKAPPPTPHAKLSVQSAVYYFPFLFLPSGPFTCPCITSSSIHPSIFPFCLLTLRPLLFAHHPTHTLRPATLPFFLSLPLCSPPLQMSCSYLPDSLASFFPFCLLRGPSLKSGLTSWPPEAPLQHSLTPSFI